MILQNIPKAFGMNRFTSTVLFIIFRILQTNGILTGLNQAIIFIFIPAVVLLKILKPTEDFRRCCGIKVYGMISAFGDLMLIMIGQHGETCCLTSLITNFKIIPPPFGGIF